MNIVKNLELRKMKDEFQDRLKEDVKKINASPNIIVFADNPNRPKKRNRKRNIIWFNPPFNKNIKTNIGKTFLKLIDKHFPRSSKLHKIFNRNTIKVSYSCTENMSMIIKKHNKKIINNKATPTTPLCNCRKKTECPLNGNCQQPSVIYQATAKIKTSQKRFI